MDKVIIESQLEVLRSIQHDYSGRTIENIISNMESILEYKEHQKND